MVDLRYELGKAISPRGHALLYFRARGRDAVVATYLVTLPVALDMAKYLPPMFAARIPYLSGGSSGAIPIPPVPEPAQSHAVVERLARIRGDDLLFGGELDVDEPEALMAAASEAAHRYGDAYDSYLRTVPAAPTSVAELNEDEALYSAMAEGDRIRELSTLVGTLRYAVDGADQHEVRDTERKMRLLASMVPAKYRAEELVAAASSSGDRASTLTHLLMQRCFKLLHEAYEELPELEIGRASCRE